MTLVGWTIFCFALALVLLIAELVLPTHGLVGFLALLAAAAGIINCYRIDPWLGTGVFIGGLVATPFAWSLFIKIWPRTPVGRKIILPPGESGAPMEACAIRVGDVGRTVSELRPIGICAFGDAHVEAISEHGKIDEDATVTIVAIHNDRPTVRPVDPRQQEKQQHGEGATSV